VGQISEFLQRLYLFFLPYFVILIRYGPQDLFDLDSHGDENFLEGTVNVDQLADISRVGIYELSVPYIINNLTS
jgi:hypothetical protein